MNSFLEYAAKSGISLLVLYLFYWLILRKDTNFRLNRIVLLFSVIVSMALPAIASHMIKAPAVLENLSVPRIEFGIPVSEPAISPAAVVPAESGDPASSASSLSFWKVIAIIYITGAFIVFARLIYQAIFLHAVSHLSVKTRHDGFTIVSTSTDMIPFSYFNRIFIPAARLDEGSFDSVIAHEKSHLSQWHYIDLFFIEVISILQWFNPIVWLYEKSIKEVHEYLADEAVLNTGKHPGKYQALLVNQALGGPVFLLTNQFNQSLIKKRIMMMKRMKTSRSAQLKAFLLMPLIAGLLLAFANPQLKSQSASGSEKVTITGNVADRTTGKNMPGSVVLIKGTTEGTVTDSDGNYRISVDNAGAVLVFTQVGYRTQVIPVGSNTKINVQLEQDIVALDFSKGNLFDANARKSGSGSENENTYVIVEEMPGYPGGTDALQNFLKANLKYPEAAMKNKIQGRVLMTYIIDVNGAVTNIKIIRGVSPELDKEALRLTNLIKGWKPASQNGRPIPVTVTMPVDFTIDK